MGANLFQLVTPFPESQIPSLFFWIARFKDMICTDDSPQSVGEFVDEWRQRSSRLKTWAVMREDGEFGGYVEYESFLPPHLKALATTHAPEAGYCDALFKESFWGRHRTTPVLDEVMESLFADKVDLVVFRPFRHNKAIRAMVKDLGAREVGDHSFGETRGGAPAMRTVFVLVPDQWSERYVSRSSNLRAVS